WAEEYGQLLDRLADGQLRQAAEMKVQGYKAEEIAERLGLARRTVHRKTNLIRKAWLGEARPRMEISPPQPGPCRLRLTSAGTRPATASRKPGRTGRGRVSRTTWPRCPSQTAYHSSGNYWRWKSSCAATAARGRRRRNTTGGSGNT